MIDYRIGTFAPVGVTLATMNMRALLLSCLTAAFFLACDEAVLQPGEEGAECRIGAEACIEGLSCLHGQCRKTDTDPDRPELRVQFIIADRFMPADGESSTGILLDAVEKDSGNRFSGQLLLFPSPSTAGRLDPAIVQFVDGLAQTSYITCRAGGLTECPEYIILNAAHVDRPLEPFSESPAIRLQHPSEEFVSAVNETSCQAGEGKMAFRRNQSETEEVLSSFSVENLEFQPAESILIIRSAGSNITLRLSTENGSTGTRQLGSQDVIINPHVDVSLPTPCNDPSSGQWSGRLDINAITTSDVGIEALDVFFELSCLGDADQVSGLRGCARFVPGMAR
jgi:hypothetical protein